MFSFYIRYLFVIQPYLEFHVQQDAMQAMADLVHQQGVMVREGLAAQHADEGDSILSPVA
ncbi:hypothetical protein D3C80_1853170 [compost metagenome]